MDRFKLKKLNKGKLRNSIRLQSKIIFSSGELKRIIGTLIEHDTLLERI
jgi:hypothetical protein